jgi:hypothetical protein
MPRRRSLVPQLILLAIAVAAVLVATLLTSGGHKAKAVFAPQIVGGQPDGAVVLAQEDSYIGVALALKPDGPGKLLAVVTALAPSGLGADHLHATVAVTTTRGTVSSAAPSGSDGTYSVVLTASGRPTRATVTLTGAQSSGKPLRFALPAQWPPRPAAALVARAERVYRRLTSLTWRERLATDPVHAIVTTYRAVAPSSLIVDSSSGVHAIEIGTRRWDRSGTRWIPSTIAADRAIAPYWSGTVQDAVLLGTRTAHGRKVSEVAFAAPQIPAFFRIRVDDATGHVLDLRMTASAHFMHHAYSGFDAPLQITPPG